MAGGDAPIERARPSSSIGGSSTGGMIVEWETDIPKLPPSYPMNGAGGFRPKSAAGQIEDYNMGSKLPIL